ncbi:MAG TPA: PAS domain S-box protein, partial [Candidatus Binatia bacterium]|nr:PAS domain S-box protein [Candidatus Binatia bacterium]
MRQSEERFRTIFETTAIGMGKIDLHTGRWQRVNRKTCAITGYSEEEMLKLGVSEITHPDEREKDWEFFQRVVRGELPVYNTEKRYVCKDGKVAWMKMSMTIVCDATGAPDYAIATIEDVTAHKEAELQRSRLATAMEQAAESVMITGLDGEILYVNPAFEKTTGYSRQEVLGQNPRILKSGRHDGVFYQELWNTIVRGNVWQGRITNKKRDGSLYQEDAIVSPIRDAAGKIVNYVSIHRDITREIELEAQFRQAQKLEGIGQLAGGVAHDFNNILAGIMMQAQLTEMRDGEHGKTAEDMQQIRRACERGANLTRQLLLFSRKQAIQNRDLDLNESVVNIAKMLQRIIGENVHIQLNLHSRPLIVHADAGMLDQVLLNLAVNGRDAMEGKGRLTIETSEKNLDAETAARHPDAAPGHYACLTVSDT